MLLSLLNRRLLKPILILSIVLTSATTLVVTNANHISAQAATQQTATEATLVASTNDQRISHGLKPLTWNADLYRAATLKAADMMTNQYFDHISPTGVTPWQFIQPEYRYLEAGENLAIDFQDPLRSIPAWMESPSHRSNILNVHYVDIAIVAIEGTIQGKRTTILVQMFGQPDFLQR